MSDLRQKACEGSIDFVNGHPGSASGVRKSNTLTVAGRTAVSAKNGIVADDMFVTVLGGDGAKGYIKTSKVARPDVKAYFGQPKHGGSRIFGVSRQVITEAMRRYKAVRLEATAWSADA